MQRAKKTFLDHSKIERECVSYSVALAEKAGYKPFSRGIKAKTGDKFYYVNRGKNLYLVTIGKKPLNEGIHFNIAHIDSPRIDLKPNPLYETEELAYFKTHYYGGIQEVPVDYHSPLPFTAESCLLTERQSMWISERSPAILYWLLPTFCRI